MRILILSLFISLSAWGQEPKAEFIGIIQFVKGVPKITAQSQKRVEINETRELKFKSFLHRGDKIKLQANDTLKFITANKCTGVVYGPGVLIAPKENNKDHTWTVESGNSRWICKNFQAQKLVLSNKSFTLSQGELIHTDNQVLVFEGKVQTNNQTLFPNIVYKEVNSTWVIATSDAIEVSSFDKKTAKPVESFTPRQPSDLPSKHSSRWTAGMIMGGGTMLVENNRYKIPEPETNGLKLTANFEAWNKDIIMSLYAFNAEEAGVQEGGCFTDTGTTIGTATCPYPAAAFNTIDSYFGTLGIRWKKHHWWSWTTSVGLGVLDYSIEASGPEFPSEEGSGHFKAEYLAMSLAGGQDFIFDFTNWLGFYGGWEVIYNQTISNLDIYPDCSGSGCGNATAPPGAASGLGYLSYHLHIGLSLLF